MGRAEGNEQSNTKMLELLRVRDYVIVTTITIKSMLRLLIAYML